MHVALLDRVDRWEPAPTQLIEVEFARICEGFTSSLISAEPAVESAAESVDWAIPGVTGLERRDPNPLPPLSPEIAALIDAYERVVAASTAKSDAQALVDNEALLGLEQRMHVDSLPRIAEVSRRGLHELVGFRSVRTWLRARRPDGDSSDATLALKLADYPVLRDGSRRWRGPAVQRPAGGEGDRPLLAPARQAGRADRRPAGRRGAAGSGGQRDRDGLPLPQRTAGRRPPADRADRARRADPRATALRSARRSKPP